MDGLAVEFEMPFEDEPARAFKPALQITLGTGVDDRFIHGLPGKDGAFLLCSFWLVDNQGRLQDAMDLYDSLCARAGPLGVLFEQIDPPSGASWTTIRRHSATLGSSQVA